MSLLLMLLSPVPAQLEQCISAVRNAPANAVQACAGPKQIDLFSVDTPSAECLAALEAGQEVGKYAASSSAMRMALAKEFEKRTALCKSPPEKEDVPTRATTQLWD